MEWTNEKELEFLEFYRAEPILWRKEGGQGGMNKLKRRDAWIKISRIMGVPVAALKKKKDSLMATYRKYRRTVRDSKLSGASGNDLYKPIWFAFDLIHSFLGDGAEYNETITTEEFLYKEEEEDEEEVNQETVSPQEADESHMNNDEIVTITIGRRKDLSELLIAGESVKDCLSTLKTTLNTRQPTLKTTLNTRQSTQQDDECDLHGKIIAKKLRLLPEDEREKFICEIYQMFRRLRPSQQQRAHSSYSNDSDPLFESPDTNLTTQ